MEGVDCHPAVALEEVVGVGPVLLPHQAHDLSVARVDQLEAVRPLGHDVVVVVQQVPVQNYKTFLL